MSDELRTDSAAWEAASDQDYLKFERELAEEARTDMSGEARACMLATEAVLARGWNTETSDAAWDSLSETEKDRAQKWDKAVEQELEEHAGAWERLAREED